MKNPLQSKKQSTKCKDDLQNWRKYLYFQISGKKNKKERKKERKQTKIICPKDLVEIVQRKYSNNQQVYEKVLKITNHERNINQSHNSQ